MNEDRISGTCDRVLVIDAKIHELLARAETLLYDVRPVPPWSYSEDEGWAAVQHALLYLSMLMDSVASAIALLVYHSMPRAALMLSRQVVEYLAKALYFDAEPEEAVFQAHYIARAQIEFLQKQRDVDQSDYDRSLKFLSDVAKRYPELGELQKRDIRRPVSVYKMLARFTEGNPASYEALYKHPSRFIHADLIGAAEMLPGEENELNGLVFEQDAIDELLLSLAWHLCSFTRVCDKRFEREKSHEIDALQGEIGAEFSRRGFG